MYRPFVEPRQGNSPADMGEPQQEMIAMSSDAGADVDVDVDLPCILGVA
jgi:hypothetical protein